MAETQLLLFPPPQPLVARFGVEFFRAVPQGPGVYFMCGDEAGVLYVGKAKNLRKRLSSYRSAHPDRLARRIFRLLFRVTRIYWDECESEAAAIERERQLLLALQPRFNAAGRYPPPRTVLIPPTDNTGNVSLEGTNPRLPAPERR
jgi:predicted GIY-YIG superfamily endonuclease